MKMTRQTAAHLLQIFFLFLTFFFLSGIWRPATSELQAADQISTSFGVFSTVDSLDDIDIEKVKPLAAKAVVVVLSVGAVLWVWCWLWHKVCYAVGFLVNGGKRHFGYGRSGGGVVNYGDATAALGRETIGGLITTLIIICIAVVCVTAYYVNSTEDSNNIFIEQQDD